MALLRAFWPLGGAEISRTFRATLAWGPLQTGFSVTGLQRGEESHILIRRLIRIWPTHDVVFH